jgi:hypothetical protein
MADKTRPGDIKQETREGRGSIYKTAIISAPIAIGGGMGLSSLSKRSSHFGEPISSIQTSPSVDAVRQFANRYVSPEHSGIFKEWQLDKLAGFSKNTALSPEVVKSAFMHAVQAADPSGMLLQGFGKRLTTARTASEVYTDVAQTLLTSSSIHTRQVASMFLRDVSALEARAAAGLPVTTTPFVGSVPRMSKSLSLGQLDERLRVDLLRFAEQTGTEFDIRRMSRRDIPGSELRLGFWRPTDKKAPWFTLRVPETLASQPGTIVHGATQQSRYLAGMYGVVSDNTLQQSFNHEQWVMRRAVEDLVPQITTTRKLTDREVRSFVSQFEQRMLEAPEWIPSMPRGMHAGLDVYSQLRSQIMRLYGRGGQPLSEFEYAQIIERGGLDLPEGGRVSLFPAHSPAQIARGVASTIDPRSYSLIPEAADVGRRPFQRYRIGAAPTPAALEAIQSSWKTQAFGWAMDPVGVPTPMARTAYLSSSLGHRLAGTGVTAEGQLLVSTALSDQRAVRMWSQLDVASDRMVDLAPHVAHSKAHWEIGKMMPKGSMLGYGPGGQPVILPTDMTIEQATAFTADRAKGDFIRVMATQDIERMRYAKVFGGAKGMAVTVSPEYIRQVLAQHAGLGEMRDPLWRTVEAVVTMDELKKNKALHYNQMLTALWDFSKHNMQSGLQISEQAQRFQSDPHAVIAQMRRIALDADKFDHNVMLREIMQLARGAKLTANQLGGVFGAIPEVYGDLGILGPLSAAEAAEVKRGVAFGFTQLHFEGLGGPGAGKTATIEPRMYELLSSPHLGGAGSAIQQEVAERMIATYPHRLAEQQELTSALRSVMKPGRRFGATPASALAAMEALPTTGTYMKVGSLGDIYIPGTSTLSQLAPYRTAGGGLVHPDLASKYMGLVGLAAEYERKGITAERMQGALLDMRDELHKARIATITGKGGLLRGRLPGSVALTAVQPTLAESLPVGVVGITEPYIEQMFGDIEQLGIYDKTELARMRSRLLAGERVSGMLGRHPYIGPYSSQVVQFQRVAGTEPIAMMHERMSRAAIFAGKRGEETLSKLSAGFESALTGDERALRRLEMSGAEMLGSPIRLSPFVGIAGDVDGDVVSAMLASPQLEKSLTGYLSNQDALRAYEEYAIRSQVLKAKAAGDAVTLHKAMAGAGIKLGITETGRLGRLSASLQQYRAGVLSGMGGLSTQESMDALGLLEWMEQTPISAKHIPAGKEEQLIYLLDDIQNALDKKNATGIAEAARVVLANAKMSGQQALREGFDIALEDVGGGVTTRHIPGLNIEKAAANIVEASRAYETAGIGKVSAARVRALMMRDLQPRTDDVEALLKPWMVTESPLSSFLNITTRPGRGAEFVERTLGIMNQAARTGKSMIPHARPLAIGTGVGLGLAMLLSEPPRVLSMEAKLPPRPVSRAGSGGIHLDANLHPGSRVNIPAPAPSPTHAANTTRILPDSTMRQQGYNISVRARLPAGVDTRSLSEQIQQSAPNIRRVHASVRDYRASLTPQRVSSILRDE